jgi:hypothetical protein
MTLKKTLASIVKAGATLGALALGSTGCAGYFHVSGCYEHSKYVVHNRNIDGDTVTFTQRRYIFADDNTMKVKKGDGRLIEYGDPDRNDLLLEFVKIKKNDTTKRYWANDTLQKQVVDTAQTQFDHYLQRILEEKDKDMKKAIEDLKK